MNFKVDIEVNLFKLHVDSLEFFYCDAILVRIQLFLLLNSLVLFPETPPLIDLIQNSGIADLIEGSTDKIFLNNVPGRKKLDHTCRFLLIWE